MLDQLDISITGLSACAPEWEANTKTNHEKSPRNTCLLLYLTKGRWECAKQGKKICTAVSGDILFLPSGCSYLSELISVSEYENCSGICLDFNILNEKHEELILGDTPQILLHDSNSQYYHLFCQALEVSLLGIGGKLSCKAIVFRLLDELIVQMSRHSFESGSCPAIYPALMEIERHPERCTSISQLSKMCFISESSLRRKFHEYTGKSPLAYRILIRIQKADELLKSSLYTVELISDILGFTDSAHFCKTYRRLRGYSPKTHKQ